MIIRFRACAGCVAAGKVPAARSGASGCAAAKANPVAANARQPGFSKLIPKPPIRESLLFSRARAARRLQAESWNAKMTPGNAC